MTYTTDKDKPHPFIGKTKKLIDRMPFLDSENIIEIWEYSNYFFGIRTSHKTSEEIIKIRNSDFAMSNNSFDFLKKSSTFLNIILNNINSCVLLLNKEMRLTAFNDALKTIFSNKKDEHLIYKRCGEAIGCAFQVEEQKDCGMTSMCNDCELRTSAVSSYEKNENTFKKQFSRPFYNADNQKIDKKLQYSTHLFYYQKDKYVVMIVEDITYLVQ